MTPVFPEIWIATLIAGALAATWHIVDGRSLVVFPLKMRYYDLLMWTRDRRMWIRETGRWASTFTAELRLYARTTAALIRHHLSTRPRYGSPEWQAFDLHLRQVVDWQRNNWREGKPPTKPAPFLPPWMLSYLGVAYWRENENQPPLGGT